MERSGYHVAKQVGVELPPHGQLGRRFQGEDTVERTGGSVMGAPKTAV